MTTFSNYSHALNHSTHEEAHQQKILHELENLLDLVPLARLSRNIRKIFMVYLTQQKEGLDPDMSEQVMDLYFLFDFLDAAEQDQFLS